MAFALETEQTKQLMAALELKYGVRRVEEIKPLLYARMLEEALQLRPMPKNRQVQEQQEARAQERAEKAGEAELSDMLNTMLAYLKVMIPNFRPEMVSRSRNPANVNVRAMQILLLTVVANLSLTHMQPLTRQMEQGYGTYNDHGFHSQVVPPWMQTKPGFVQS